MNEILRLENVNKRFSGVIVANNVSINFHRGDIIGLIGPNGAGKTSLLNLITGLYPLDHGTILFKGKRINNESMHRRARLGISRTWQNIRLFQSMTALDNLLLSGREYKGESLFNLILRPGEVKKASNKLKERAMELLDRVGLSSVWDKRVSEFSYGMQKLVAIARGLMNDGSCLLLDEPIAGVEGRAYDKIKEVVHEEAEKGKAVCVVEHSISFLKDFCSRAIFLFNGQVIRSGSIDELLSSSELQQMYFGASKLMNSPERPDV